jgi:hypothetical protein
LTETTQGNEGNGADQPRARSSTERSRAHRAKKKLEREAALQAERDAALQKAERVAEAVAGVAGDVASVEDAVAGAAPRPTEPKVEREAAPLHEAERTEREAGATETATIERVAGRVADVAEAVAPENAVSSPPAVAVASSWNGVPAVSPPLEWRTVERPVWRPTVPALCRWTFGGMSVLLSFVLYAISTVLNMSFWAGLNPDVTAKQILAAAGFTVELSNYVIPTVLAFAPSSKLGLRRVVRAVLCFTMVITAIAGAGVVKNSLGASHVSRKETIEERDRLQAIVKSNVKPASDDAVKDARGRVDTAKVNRKTTCAPTRTLDVDECNKARAEVLKAEAALASENTNHASAVTTAEQRHRDDVAGAQAKLDRLPVISVDLDIVTAGVEAIVPGVPEAWVTRGVVVLWVLLFSIGPCAFLRLGLVTIEEGYR